MLNLGERYFKHNAIVCESTQFFSMKIDACISSPFCVTNAHSIKNIGHHSIYLPPFSILISLHANSWLHIFLTFPVLTISCSKTNYIHALVAIFSWTIVSSIGWNCRTLNNKTFSRECSEVFGTSGLFFNAYSKYKFCFMTTNFKNIYLVSTTMCIPWKSLAEHLKNLAKSCFIQWSSPRVSDSEWGKSD